MSTKRKKLYSRQDIKDAEKESELVRNYYSRKNKHRRTVQIRLDEKWHKKIRDFSKSEKMVMSVLLDKICDHFFKHYS